MTRFHSLAIMISPRLLHSYNYGKTAKCFRFHPFYPKNPKGTRISILSQTCIILKIVYLQNYNTDSNQILHSRPPSLIFRNLKIAKFCIATKTTNYVRGWSKQAYNKYKVADDHHLQKSKNRQILHSDRDENFLFFQFQMAVVRHIVL